MFRNHDKRRARLDRLRLEALRALEVSEAEVEAVASSPESYERVQARIAAKRRQRDESARSGGRRTSAWLLTELSKRRRLAFAAAVALILLAATAYWLRTAPNTQTDAQKQIGILPHPAATEHPVTPVTRDTARGAGAELKPEKPAALRRTGRTARRRPAPDQVNIEEVATAYIPLTYINEATGADSGQVMRIRVPRAMLASMGVPASIERTDGFVLADVVIGDDGLARAIRLVN